MAEGKHQVALLVERGVLGMATTLELFLTLVARIDMLCVMI